jgi:phospholipid transport system substrate-binding protein
MVADRQHIWARLIRTLWGALGLLVIMAGPAGADQDPRAVIEALHVALLDSMRNADQLGYQGRYRLLEPVLRRSYNFDFMTRIAVGREWADLNPSEQAQLTDLFAQMSIANYAARFNGYSGERFETVAEAPGPRDAVVVQTRLVRPKDEPVELNYVMREFPDGWRIIDVLLEGKFSELAKQRAEFAAVLKDGGAPRLIAMLEKKIKALAGPT